MADKDNAAAASQEGKPVDLSKIYPRGVAEQVACFIKAQGENPADLRERTDDPIQPNRASQVFVLSSKLGFNVQIEDSVNHPDDKGDSIVQTQIQKPDHTWTTIQSHPEGMYYGKNYPNGVVSIMEDLVGNSNVSISGGINVDAGDMLNEVQTMRANVKECPKLIS